MSKWISVKDRLPEPDTSILAFSPERDEIIICSYVGFSYKYGEDGAWMYWGENPPDYITHWMPLPQKPESE